MSFLFGVPAKLRVLQESVNTLLSRVSSAVSSRIDANISSRAPASTALSNGQWTNGRATLLDELAKVEGIRTSSLLNRPSVIGTPPIIAGIPSALSDSSLPSYTSALVGTSNVTLLDLTGEGVVDFLSISRGSGPGNLTTIITIDGQVLSGPPVITTTTGGFVVFGFMKVSGGVFSGLSFETVSFKSSFKVEVVSSSATASTVTAHCKWRRSA